MTLRGKSDPDWPALVEDGKATQERLRRRMIVAPLEPLPRFVAGADCAFSADKLVLTCPTRYRIPEPPRRADIEVAKLKRASDIPAASLHRSRIS